MMLYGNTQQKLRQGYIQDMLPKILNVEELETLPARAYTEDITASIAWRNEAQNEAAFDDFHWIGKDQQCKIAVSLLF